MVYTQSGSVIPRGCRVDREGPVTALVNFLETPHHPQSFKREFLRQNGKINEKVITFWVFSEVL